MNNQSEYQNQQISSILSFENIKGASQLLKESWKIYENKFHSFLKIIIIPAFLFFFLQIIFKYFLSSYTGYTLNYLLDILTTPGWIIFITVSLFYLFVMIIFLVTIPALIYRIKEKNGIKEIYCNSFKILPSLFYIIIIEGFIIFGTIFFLAIFRGIQEFSITLARSFSSWFLLFPLAGAIFAIWFSLSFFTLIFEGKKGINALLSSKQLIFGRFESVLWRFFILFIVIGIVTLPLQILSKTLEKVWIFGSLFPILIELLILPFVMIYGYLIYENLKILKKDISYQPPSGKEKILFNLVAIIGVLTLIVWIIKSISTPVTLLRELLFFLIF